MNETPSQQFYRLLTEAHNAMLRARNMISEYPSDELQITSWESICLDTSIAEVSKILVDNNLQ